MDKETSQFFKQASRQDLLSFCVFTDQFYEIAPHHELINDALVKLVNWEIQNLIIEMPPRSWKSRIMQEFIAKLYGDKPKTDILYTWHSLSLLEWFSRNIINRIKGNEYQSLYNTKFVQWSESVKNWNIEKGWEFAVYWVWGWITGKGWNILIIDDPYATRQDAESDTVRRTVSNWYWSTFLSRKQNDKAQQIIIMQRWREDDLVWEILEREWEKWTELKIPALNENEESFWADRFSAEYFKDIKKQNPLFFASQYQQDPVNEWSWDFIKEYFTYCDWIEVQQRQPRMDIITFIDPAISQKQEADSTAIVTIWMDSTNNMAYLLEVKKLKETPDEIINETFRTVDKFKDEGKSYKCWIETVQYQKMLELEIRNQMRIRDKFFNLEWIKPTWEKAARIRSLLQPRYSSRSIIHAKDLNWLWDLEIELLKFPNGKHDDLIDALAWCFTIAQVTNVNQKMKVYTPNYI